MAFHRFEPLLGVDNWKSITSESFVFNMAMGHHLQLRCHAPLFHDFKQFNIKAALSHHPFIQKKVNKVLAKGIIEPFTHGAGFILMSLLYLCA